VSSYSITIFLDRARVRLVSAKAQQLSVFPDPTVDTSVADEVTLSATGSSGSFTYTTILADLVFEMDTAATQGSLLSLKVNSLVAADQTTDLVPSHRTKLLDVCQAVRIWGDVDSTLTVNSRDALIVLTASVGIAVTGFNVDLGDVDQDMQTTARDALFILSAGIGLYVPSNVAVGRAIPNACAPLEPMPNDMAFWIGSGLTTIGTGDTTVVALGVLGNNSWQPSWAPDASRILYTQWISGYGYDFIAVTPDGLTADTLFASTAYDFAPAWSPEGTRIAFVSGTGRVSPQALFIMNADATNQVQITTGDTMTVFQVAWSPDGSTLTFTGYNAGACCTPKLWTIAPDGTGLTEVFPSSNFHAPQDPVWSSAGDSIAYDYPSQSRIYRVAASGATAGGPALPLLSSQDYPGWVGSGMLFMTGLLAGDYAFSRATDGRQLRLTRGLANSGYRPDWRRIGVYVNAVTVAPTTATLSLSGTTTQQFAETVVDNGGSPIIPGSGITWSSSDTLVVTVDQSGLATAVGVGPATIFATAGGWRTGSASVTVNP
jgi:uncharacterized protein YjdB